MIFLKNALQVAGRIGAVVLILFIAFWFVIFALFYATIPLHDFAFWDMRVALERSSSHPIESQFVEHHTFFGSRYTDIEECTYAIGEFRATTHAPEEVLRAYQNMYAGRFPLQVFIVGEHSGLALDNPADTWLAQFAETHATTIATYYLLYLYKPHQPWWGDWRCYETGFEDGKEISQIPDDR